MNLLILFLANIRSSLRRTTRIHPPDDSKDRTENRRDRALSLEEAERMNKGTITYFFPSVHP
jgi:hypothetical protein